MGKIRKHKEMDMLNGGIVGKLIMFAIPLACSSILQQLFNSADVAVVGRFAGDKALAAVGRCRAFCWTECGSGKSDRTTTKKKD